MPSIIKSPGSVSGYAWYNIENVKLSDDKYASCLVYSSYPSSGLICTNYSFNVPLNCNITGVVAKIEAKGGSVNEGLYISSVKLTKNGSAVIGNNLASHNYLSTADVIYSFGQSDNIGLWGATLTPSEINDSTFGVVISIGNENVSYNLVPNIDHVQITIYYEISITQAYVTSIPSAEAFGMPALSEELRASPVGIVSHEYFGMPLVVGPQQINPINIFPQEEFGTPSIGIGVSFIDAYSIDSGEKFGSLLVKPEGTALTAFGIASAEAFSVPIIRFRWMEVPDTSVAGWTLAPVHGEVGWQKVTFPEVNWKDR